jgi:hypothetical protein
VTHTAYEIVRLRTLRKPPEPWWQERGRLGRHCPRCTKFYIRGCLGWRLCLECETNPKWKLVLAAEFIAEGKKVFPGAHELPRPVETEDDGGGAGG